MISNNTPHTKLFGCNIHGFIRVQPMALKIIHTKEFQRLRHIKQLGLCTYVFPSATHTRFAHSIGVYHLAGLMIDKLRLQYPMKIYDILELNGQFILDAEIAELIKIAGLCHDIGHGPFSHIFDDVFLEGSSHPNRHHETRSCLITEMICKRVLPELSQEKINFIKSIICPTTQHTGVLYQIVANYLNGIDVDKFDYLSRDTYNLGLKKGFDHRRIIDEIIIDENNNIAYPKHCSSDIFDMFYTRYMMHKQIYTHKTVKLIEVMVCDMFKQINPFFHISDSIDNMENFCRLTDASIFQYVENYIYQLSYKNDRLDLSAGQSMKYQHMTAAYEIYSNILERKLYKIICNAMPDKSISIYDIMTRFINDTYPENTDDFIIITTSIGFVGGNKNPFSSIYFYDKKEHNTSFIISNNHISGILCDKYQETSYLLVCKDLNIYHDAIVKWHYYMESVI